ncbi:lysophospholipid acyltransferase family protein [Streptomyces megasporus]|uniref:lysophospholipid acyltransferase family protein n=1 Tax=Streptomyces megasporus TaxID=44060 RepID=UPI000996D859|nr:lysophospholipid acyltransferase family protein [Streptomyces megasporus]
MGHPGGGAAGAGPWSPISPCTVAGCLPDRPAVVGPLRRAARWAALTAVLAAGVAPAPAVRRSAPARRERWVRRWAGAITVALGVRVHVTGAPEAGTEGAALVVANHVSWLDVPLLASVTPGRMLAKREIGDQPVLGRLVARGGTLFIDRERLRALPGTVGAITEALRAGSTVVAFPEGSTWCGRRQGVFRRAVFQAAMDAGVPVRPMAIRYRTRDGRPAATASSTPAGTPAAFVGDDTLVASLRRVVAARGLVAEVTVLPPLPPGAHPDRRALARAAQEAVAGAAAPTTPTTPVDPADPTERKRAPAGTPRCPPAPSPDLSPRQPSAARRVRRTVSRYHSPLSLTVRRWVA